MEYKVICSNLETLSEDYRNMGINLDNIISEYNTLGYEILNNVSTEDVETIKLAIEEIKKLLNEGFITVKKHENFLINAKEKYKGNERILAEGLNKYSEIYSAGGTYQPGVVIPTPTTTYINHNVTDLVVDDLPSTTISNVNIKKDKNDIIIPGIKDIITNKNTVIDDSLRIIIGLVSLIAPGAIITGLTTILPGYVGHIFGLNGDYTGGGDWNSSERYGNNFDKLLDLVGQAFQTNYNLIDILAFNFIINSIINGSIFIGELGKYSTLSDLYYGDISGINNDYGKDKEDEEADKNKEEDQLDGYNRYRAQEEDAEREDIKKEIQNDENKDYTTDVNQFESIDAANIEGEFATTKIEDGELNQYYNAASGSIIEETEKILAREAMELDVAELPKSEATTGSGTSGGGGDSVAGGGSLSGGVSLETDSLSSSSGSSYYGDTSATAAEEVVKSKVDYTSQYNTSENIYDRILKSQSTDNSSLAFGKKEAAAIGMGIASLGGIGGLGAMGSFATETLGTEGGKLATNFIIGSMNFANVFDMVGNAQMCNLSWLSEITNVLAQ